MIIDMGNERIDICCYEMMQQLLYRGINDEWQVCPFCTATIECIEEDNTSIETIRETLGETLIRETLGETLGDIHELHPM